jgi:hypothetical protein
MTINDIHTVLLACDRAKAKALKARREADDKLEKIEALRAAVTAEARRQMR